MSVTSALSVRVTGVRSQSPRGFGGAIFTGVPIDAHGAVVSASSYLVVRVSAGVLGSTRVERGQWWNVSGKLAERSIVVEGVALIEQQVEADAAELARPSGEHIVSFIAQSPEFDGLGMVKARRLWERFGNGLYDLLDAGDSDALAFVLTADAAQRLVKAWALHGQSRSLQWLQAQGFDLRIGHKVLEFFGDKAQDLVEEDPYRLLSFCGEWAVVDRLAREKFGLRKDDARRLRGAVEEACYRVFANGHTSMLSAELVDRVKPLLGTPPEGVRWRDLLAAAVSEGLSNGSFVQVHHGLQPLGALVMERQVAAAIHSRLMPEVDQGLIDADAVEQVISDVYAHDGVELNPEQRNAIHLAARHAFVCITGGAGVGKTTVLKALYHLYDRAHVKVLQVALSGRAAKRMQEATNRPASTIASFLKDLGEGSLAGPTVLVIDEASMVDIISMSRICDALPSHVRLVLVGDPHQLMPVGPGLVLHCVQKLDGIPVAELKTVKRYGGDIAAVASAVRAGTWPAMIADETAAVAFIPCEDRLVAQLVVELYGLQPKGTQILAPARNGPAGTKALNTLCQERFSKGQRTVTCWNDEFEVAEHCGLNVGDMVLCTRNLWDKGLQNGSLGQVVQVEDTPRGPPSGKGPSVLASIVWDGDDTGQPLTSDMLDDIELGYAVTVHKAQGSQWPRIIIPVTSSKFLDRTLLYTAITRSQQQVILVGDPDAARRAVIAPPRAHERNVALDLALAKLLDKVGSGPVTIDNQRP